MEQICNEERLMSAVEVAKLLNIGLRTVWRLSSNGVLPPPAVRQGRIVRWLRGDIIRWINAQAERNGAGRIETKQDGRNSSERVCAAAG